MFFILAAMYVLAICLTYNSGIMQSYIWTLLTNKRIAISVRVILVSIYATCLVPIVIFQYFFIGLADALCPIHDEYGEHWTFLRLRLVTVQWVYHEGAKKPIYRNIKGDLL